MFLGPNSIGFVWSAVGRALLRFMEFLVVFAMPAFLETFVTCGTHSKRCKWGCCDGACLLGYKWAFFAISSLASGWSRFV